MVCLLALAFVAGSVYFSAKKSHRAPEKPSVAVVQKNKDGVYYIHDKGTWYVWELGKAVNRAASALRYAVAPRLGGEVDFAEGLFVPMPDPPTDKFSDDDETVAVSNPATEIEVESKLGQVLSEAEFEGAASGDEADDSGSSVSSLGSSSSDDPSDDSGGGDDGGGGDGGGGDD